MGVGGVIPTTMTEVRPPSIAVGVLSVLLVAAPVAAMAGVGAGVGGPAGASHADGPHAAGASPTSSAVNATAGTASMAPGERVAGVVGVGRAEVEGAVQARALDRALARANADDGRAAVLASVAATVDERLADLGARRQALERARQNGSISEGRYRAEIAALAARAGTLRDLANRTGRAATALPADVLAAKGVSVSSIEALRTRATNLTGPEVAAIAREVAGEDPGRGFGPPASPGTNPHGAAGTGAVEEGSDGDETPGEGTGTPPSAPGGGTDEPPTAGTPEPPVDPVTMTNATASG